MRPITFKLSGDETANALAPARAFGDDAMQMTDGSDRTSSPDFPPFIPPEHIDEKRRQYQKDFANAPMYDDVIKFIGKAKAQLKQDPARYKQFGFVLRYNAQMQNTLNNQIP